jgi:hypothetical protein
MTEPVHAIPRDISPDRGVQSFPLTGALVAQTRLGMYNQNIVRSCNVYVV